MKSLIIGLLTIGSISAFAGVLGTADEDPIVANLRSRFQKGIEPNKVFLLQHEFKCKEMIARRGDFTKRDYNSELKFEEFDGFLTSIQTDSNMNNVLFTFNDKELIGSNKINGGVFYEAYRVDSKGFLISEFTYNGQDITAELSPISSAKGKVETYTLCIPKI